MKCPKCKRKAINFIKWIKGTNAFKTHCQECDISIVANYKIYICFVITILICFIQIPYVYEWYNQFEVGSTHRILKTLIFIPTILLGAVIAWFVGDYKIDKKAK